MTVSNSQRRSRRFQKAQPGLRDSHEATPTLALTALAAQGTPGLVKAIFPLCLKLATSDCSGEREKKASQGLTHQCLGNWASQGVPEKSRLCPWSQG